MELLLDDGTRLPEQLDSYWNLLPKDSSEPISQYEQNALPFVAYHGRIYLDQIIYKKHLQRLDDIANQRALMVNNGLLRELQEVDDGIRNPRPSLTLKKERYEALDREVQKLLSQTKELQDRLQKSVDQDQTRRARLLQSAGIAEGETQVPPRVQVSEQDCLLRMVCYTRGRD